MTPNRDFQFTANLVRSATGDVKSFKNSRRCIRLQIANFRPIGCPLRYDLSRDARRDVNRVVDDINVFSLSVLSFC